MSTLQVNTIQNTDGQEVYTAKAWVTFDGNGTVAIISGGNVSSITDNGTGDYTVNFTNNMVDANYLPVPHCGTESSTNIYTISTTIAYKTISSIRVINNSSNGTNVDTGAAGLAVFR